LDDGCHESAGPAPLGAEVDEDRAARGERVAQARRVDGRDVHQAETGVADPTARAAGSSTAPASTAPASTAGAPGETVPSARSARNRSASSAAEHPVPAAVIA